jgi:4-hydroxy-tetrahydrodipicolinate reductase
MIKVTIAGAAGRMGHALTRCVTDAQDMEVVGAVERADHPELGKDTGETAGIGNIGVPITDDLSAAMNGADVLVEFTFHTAVPGNAEIAADMGKAVVIGTTALDEKQRGRVKAAATRVPIVCAPNMSLGVNLLFAMAKKAGSVLGADYRVSIDETHHIHKKDAPSGTALRLGEKVADGRDIQFDSIYVHDEGGKSNDHPEGKLIIRSYREDEVVGDHTVRFENSVERVELTHNAHSRDALALGTLHAVRWVVSQTPGLYDMQNVLGL